MAVADSKLNHAYNEINNLQEQVYDYEEASSSHSKSKGKQKVVAKPRKCACANTYDTDNNPLSWQEGALSLWADHL
jgi:hypothetical protein